MFKFRGFRSGTLNVPKQMADELDKQAIRFGPPPKQQREPLKIAARIREGEPFIRGYLWSAWRDAIIRRLNETGGLESEIVEHNDTNMAELYGTAFVHANAMCNVSILHPTDYSLWAGAIQSHSRIQTMVLTERDGWGPPSIGVGDVPHINPGSSLSLFIVKERAWIDGRGEWADVAPKMWGTPIHALCLSDDGAFWQPEFINLQ